jgi:hypothetical protein
VQLDAAPVSNLGGGRRDDRPNSGRGSSEDYCRETTNWYAIRAERLPPKLGARGLLSLAIVIGYVRNASISFTVAPAIILRYEHLAERLKLCEIAGFVSPETHMVLAHRIAEFGQLS